VVDATQEFNKPLTAERLWGWQAGLFPDGQSGLHKIRVGAWRDDKHGPMQIVSGPMGRERIHYEAPEAACLDVEMKNFLIWFNGSTSLTINGESGIDPVIKAAIAHLWFVTIHPFEDGNGRIARAITDMQLARADGSAQRFYSMSVQIRQERNAYYDVLEKIQGNTDMDITPWIDWFLGCLDRALGATENTLAGILKKAHFWETHSQASLNQRQVKIINMLFDDFQGNITSSKWAKMTKCSHDTALRDIVDLINKNILIKAGGSRNISYSLNLA
jgi:Fic family protein